MAIAPERCCGKRLTHRLQSTAQALSPFNPPSSSGESLCCLRTVLEPKRGNAEAILYEAAAGGELDLLKVGKKGYGKKVAYKYLALDFGGEKEKRAVEKAVEQVMLLRRKIKQKALEGVKADVGVVKKWGILR